MKSLKTIFKKINDAFPYFYFMTYFLILLVNQFIPVMRGNSWTVSYIFCISLIFPLQFIYRFKHLDFVLGILTLLGSFWMLLAAFSDSVNGSPWTFSDVKVFIIACFVIVNFYSSISLLTKKQRADNISVVQPKQHKKESFWKSAGKNFLFLARVTPKF
jgi:hypothetical protein